MSKPLRVRITGDASDPNTLEVFDAATGEKINNVLAIDFHLEGVPADCRVTLTIFGADLDLEADADVETIHP